MYLITMVPLKCEPPLCFLLFLSLTPQAFCRVIAPDQPTDFSQISPSLQDRTSDIASYAFPCHDKPFTTCPLSDDGKRKRLFCMYGQTECPETNTYYFCGRDPDNNIMIEDCFPRHTCAPGSMNAVRVSKDNGKTTKSLICVQCDEHHIQQGTHDSSQRFTSQCESPRMTVAFLAKMDKMIRIEVNWPFGYDLYACDSKLGYSNYYHTSLCDINSFCVCMDTVKCTDADRPELLPNGTCDSPCSRTRDPFTNFSCPRDKSNNTRPTTPDPEKVSTQTVSNVSYDTRDIEKEPGQTHQPRQTAKPGQPDRPSPTEYQPNQSLSLEVIILIIIAVLVLVGVVVVIVKHVRKVPNKTDATPHQHPENTKANTCITMKGKSNTVTFGPQPAEGKDGGEDDPVTGGSDGGFPTQRMNEIPDETEQETLLPLERN